MKTPWMKLAAIGAGSLLAMTACSPSAQEDTADAEDADSDRSEEHTSELQSRFDLVCRLLLEKKNNEPLGTSETTRASTRGQGQGVFGDACVLGASGHVAGHDCPIADGGSMG